ncbi:MAG: hypothetical protein QNK11_04485 [Legionella sp.]|nr:hypothetical protein [Legionella sp.]
MKREDQLFLVGLVSLIFSLFLFPFVAYLFPAVWLGWEYRIPGFVLDAALWLEVTFHTTYVLAFKWFFRLTFLAAVFFGGIAYLISRHISKLQTEGHLTAQEEKNVSKLSTKAKQNSKEAVLFFLKMVVILALVFIVADVIQWAISFSPEAR